MRRSIGRRVYEDSSMAGNPDRGSKPRHIFRKYEYSPLLSMTFAQEGSSVAGAKDFHTRKGAYPSHNAVQFAVYQGPAASEHGYTRHICQKLPGIPCHWRSLTR